MYDEQMDKELTVIEGDGLREKEIQNQALGYLRYNRVWCWQNNNTGIWDPTRQRFRRPGSFFLRGVSDILGIYKGRLLAIEVKSATGKLSEYQREFLDEMNSRGGIALVIRSIDDIDKKLFIKYGRE